MRRKFLLFMLIVFSAVALFACSSLDGIGLAGKENAVDNSSNGQGGTTTDNGSGSISGGSNDPSDKFDDQLKESDVNDDFTNPLNFIGRYKIVSLTVKDSNDATILAQNYGENIFKGNLGVDVDLSNLSNSIVAIKIALKYQFHPTVVSSIPIENRFEFFSKALNVKNANLNSYLGDLTAKISAIFKDLGAEVVDNKYIQFTLTNIDVPVNYDEKMIILLEKVGNKPMSELISDGNRYWNSDGSETEKPEIPSDNGTVTPPDDGGNDDVIIPDEPVEGVTEINFNDLSTLNGHYEIVRFYSEANAPIVGKQVVASDDPSRVQRMQGEMSINSTQSNASVISKMQMDSTYLDSMGQGDDKFTYTVYPDFGIAGSILTNKDSDKIEPYGDSKTLIKITQSFTKKVSGMNVPVNVTVTVRKISDTPKDIPNKPYWGDGSGENDPEKPIITPVDFINNPASIEGNYKISNICYNYKRPGGAWENICADNPTTIQNMVGDLSIQYDGGVATDSYVTSKTQLIASWFTTPLFHEFNDPRWLFLYENKTKNVSISQTENANEVKILFQRVLKYRTGVSPWWTNHNVNVDITIWAEKISDQYKEIDGSKFF